MSAYKTIETLTEGHTATVWLDRQEKRNAMNPQMVHELLDCIAVMKNNPKVRVLILRGKGSHFCAGADLNWMQVGNLKPEERPSYLLPRLFMALFDFTKPLLVAVNGHAMGGALGLIACGDFVFAGEEAVFSFSEVKLGLIPATISPFVVRRIGELRSRQLMLSGARINAETARETGLADRVFPAEKMDEKIAELAGQLSENAPGAMKLVKPLIKKVSAEKLEKKLTDYTADMLQKVQESKEAKEGIQAFLEKRKPVWPGNND